METRVPGMVDVDAAVSEALVLRPQSQLEFASRAKGRGCVVGDKGVYVSVRVNVSVSTCVRDCVFADLTTPSSIKAE